MKANPEAFDLLVYGGTEAGVIASVRAARLGLRVALVSETSTVHGFFPSLGALETHYPGNRAPLWEELRSEVIAYYATTYGVDSREYRTCVTRESNNPMISFEPHVMEGILDALVSRESGIETVVDFRLDTLDLDQGRVLAVEGHMADRRARRLEAHSFVDASYCGDLAAAAGCRYRVGREGREEHGETHAGCMFTRWKDGRFPRAAVEGRLNLLPTWSTIGPLPDSTGEGDGEIQDYSYRLCLTSDPSNRIPLERPAGYDPAHFEALLEAPAVKARKRYPFHHRWLTHSLEEMVRRDHLIHGHSLPGGKRSWNATNLTGRGSQYPEGAPETRRAIEQAHREHALGLLYFLQTDDRVPPAIRQAAGEWGLAADEFRDSGNLPPALYVREARRFMGGFIYREQDCLPAAGIERPPIHADGIGFTEFALDSLACTSRRVNGSLPDGQFFEKDKSRPGSFPWRCLVPAGMNNLLVPTNPSVTHCAWGTVRQSASLVHLAEVCGFAAAVAKQDDCGCGEVDVVALQRELVTHGVMIAFFNDFDMATEASWVPAVQFFGNRGYFWGFDARAEDPLTPETLDAWLALHDREVNGIGLDRTAAARRVREAEVADAATQNGSREIIARISNRGWELSDPAGRRLRAIADGRTITRGDFLEWLYTQKRFEIASAAG